MSGNYDVLDETDLWQPPYCRNDFLVFPFFPCGDGMNDIYERIFMTIQVCHEIFLGGS